MLNYTFKLNCKKIKIFQKNCFNQTVMRKLAQVYLILKTEELALCVFTPSSCVFVCEMKLYFTYCYVLGARKHLFSIVGSSLSMLSSCTITDG